MIIKVTEMGKSEVIQVPDSFVNMSWLSFLPLLSFNEVDLVAFTQ